MSEYFVIESTELFGLVMKVNVNLAAGSACQGGIWSNGNAWYQAMIAKVPESAFTEPTRPTKKAK